MKNNRFLQFIKGIAYGKAEWQYANGDEMRKDAKKFLSYFQKLQKKVEKE